MGILNAIFAPFIVLYVLMYSFFRYFEVGDMFKNDGNKVQLFFLYSAAISQGPIDHRRSTIHLLRQLEVSGVQRAATHIYSTVGRKLSSSKYVHWAISQ